jgi:predicted phosphodiesterase
VEIGGERYYDSEGGSARTDLTVHKVTVPASELDAAGAYTIYTRNMIVRTAYGALQGRTVSKTYSFRPVDESDGIQFFAISDIHDYKSAAVKSASYYGDKLDFLIVAGDISSFIPRQYALDFINKVAFDVTKGTRPVIYARGNHETRGNASGDLHRYVGADGANYYYSFRLGSLWGIVLDMAEDKEDANWEYYGAADYESYREKELAYLDSILERADSEFNAPDVQYRIAISHVTTAFTGADRTFADVFKAYNERLNQMNLDVMISGHRHKLMYLEGGYAAGEEYNYSTAYNSKAQDKPDIVTMGADFPAALVSCHSDTQLYTKAAPFTSKFTGGAFEYANGALTLTYINSRKAPVSVISPWFPIEYGETITIKTLV